MHDALLLTDSLIICSSADNTNLDPCCQTLTRYWHFQWQVWEKSYQWQYLEPVDSSSWSPWLVEVESRSFISLRWNSSKFVDISQFCSRFSGVCWTKLPSSDPSVRCGERLSVSREVGHSFRSGSHWGHVLWLWNPTPPTFHAPFTERQSSWTGMSC